MQDEWVTVFYGEGFKTPERVFFLANGLMITLHMCNSSSYEPKMIYTLNICGKYIHINMWSGRNERSPKNLICIMLPEIFLNIKILSYWFKYSHYKDKTVLWLLYFKWKFHTWKVDMGVLNHTNIMSVIPFCPSKDIEAELKSLRLKQNGHHFA